MDTAQLKKVYKETIAPALQKQFNYSSAMEIQVLKKIVINQGLGDATQDKKIVDVAINEITAITGQKAVATYSKKDIANFKLRKKMPIGVMVTLRRGMVSNRKSQTNLSAQAVMAEEPEILCPFVG